MGKYYWVSLFYFFLLNAVGTLATTNDLPQPTQGDSSVESEESVESQPDTRQFEGLIQNQLSKFLSQYEDLHIPALPPLNINGDDQYSISLALSNLNIRGISDIDVTAFTHTSEGIQDNKQDFQTFRMKFNKLFLDVGTYNAAGHLLNLPFNGEGPMSLGFINLDITIDFTWDNFTFVYIGNCVADDTSKYDLDVQRMQVQFDGLNEGTDQGQLINIVLSSFGPDIIDYLEVLLNSSLYPAVDDALVAILNGALSCPNNNNTEQFDISEVPVIIEDLLTSFLPFQEYKNE
ncbi:hypothetical protein Pcinc_023088 [Petrolisthes cinctipes]|uniref:Uncharacterized protein n=1 Tax=Petrolisthes cinctipes TaxID=88211 RepID=A0AAE1KEY1_PETCI|nr:hypothetical protein Pcinc_023088 [Petrolisthes cinctipes]